MIKKNWILTYKNRLNQKKNQNQSKSAGTVPLWEQTEIISLEVNHHELVLVLRKDNTQVWREDNGKNIWLHNIS